MPKGNITDEFQQFDGPLIKKEQSDNSSNPPITPALGKRQSDDQEKDNIKRYQLTPGSDPRKNEDEDGKPIHCVIS